MNLDDRDEGDLGDDYDPHEDVPEWTDEDEERYQARQHEERRRRRRRRRQGWSFTFLVLIVLGAGVAGAGIIQGWWEWPFGRESGEVAECDTAEPSLAAPGEVRVRVLNATETAGLAGSVGTELGARGYRVASVGNDESGVDVLEGAQIRYGPGLEAQAQSVALNFRRAVLVDDGRTGDVVDLALGTGYTRLAPAEEVTAKIAAAAAAAGCAPATTPPPTPTG